MTGVRHCLHGDRLHGDGRPPLTGGIDPVTMDTQVEEEGGGGYGQVTCYMGMRGTWPCLISDT